MLTEKGKDAIVSVSIAMVCLGLGIGLGAYGSRQVDKVRIEGLDDRTEELDSTNVSLGRQADSLLRVCDSLERECNSLKGVVLSLEKENGVYKYWCNESLNTIRSIVGDDSYFAKDMETGLKLMIDYD